MSRAAALPPAAASWLLNLTVSRAAKPPRPVASRSPNPLEHRPPARRVRATGSEDAPPGGGTGAGKSGKYTDEMQRRMGGGLTYKHEEGINFSYVLPDVVVGSCPQSPADVDRWGTKVIRGRWSPAGRFPEGARGAAGGAAQT